MDITARKYKFIEEFMKIISSEKIDKLAFLEDVLHADETPEIEKFDLTEKQLEELDSIRARHLSEDGNSFSLEELRQKFQDTYGVSI